MKTELFSFREKEKLFSEAQPMHDCSFVAVFDQGTLVLVFDHLESYFGFDNAKWFEGYRKLTIKYHNADYLNLSLKYGRKEKNFYDTVAPLDGNDLIMYKFSVDSFDEMTLYFRIWIKKKLWGGKIEISPSEIEYIWE